MYAPVKVSQWALRAFWWGLTELANQHRNGTHSQSKSQLPQSNQSVRRYAMAIDFQKTFGNNPNNVKSNTNNEDRPKAQLWLNIGYDSGVTDGDGNTKFVSLPTGIPLDTQEHLPTNSRNRDFAAFQSARNDLLQQILDVGMTLEQGEERTLNLTIQLRRVNSEQEAIEPKDNQYVRPLELVAAA